MFAVENIEYWYSREVIAYSHNYWKIFQVGAEGIVYKSSLMTILIHVYTTFTVLKFKWACLNSSMEIAKGKKMF